MGVELLTPLGALVGLAALVPLAAAALRERRFARVRAELGLEPPPRPHLARATAVLALFALLAAAAAQPVLVQRDDVVARTDAELFVLVDVSRSMLASASPGSSTRFERAVRLALRVRTELADVPAGVASITDRPLPHLFPTSDADVFAAVVGRSLGVDRPPPSERQRLATDLGLLVALARDNYFSPRSARRLTVLLTDGESRPFAAAAVARRLARAGIGLVVVRVGAAGERVFGPGGRLEPAYTPDRSADADVERLATLTVGGRVFGEGDLGGIAAAARAHLGSGPAVWAGESERADPLAGYLALAAGIPLAFLLVSLGLRPVARGSARRPAWPRARTGSPRSVS